LPQGLRDKRRRRRGAGGQLLRRWSEGNYSDGRTKITSHLSEIAMWGSRKLLFWSYGQRKEGAFARAAGSYRFKLYGIRPCGVKANGVVAGLTRWGRGRGKLEHTALSKKSPPRQSGIGLNALEKYLNPVGVDAAGPS